jgi:hypothetical protein
MHQTQSTQCCIIPINVTPFTTLAEEVAQLRRNLTLALEAEAACNISLGEAEGRASTYLSSYSHLSVGFAASGGAVLLEHSARLAWATWAPAYHRFPLDV